MTFAPDPDVLWRFRSTGRHARVVLVRSTGKRDRVEFRFVDDNTVRTVNARRFLADFERVS